MKKIEVPFDFIVHAKSVEALAQESGGLIEISFSGCMNEVIKQMSLDDICSFYGRNKLLQWIKEDCEVFDSGDEGYYLDQMASIEALMDKSHPDYIPALLK